MSEQTTKKILATVVDVAWVSDDKFWKVTLVAEKGVCYERCFYTTYPPSLNDELEITI